MGPTRACRPAAEITTRTRRRDAPQTVEAKLAGVFAPICTPFAANEDVDHGALQFNLARYAESGILGYLALGSNGENRSLTEDERRRVLDDVVRHKGPGQMVLAGAAYDGQREAEGFLAAAADLGADFGLVLSPGYFRAQMTDEVLYRYFSGLADEARIPLLLYNAPGFCGVTLSPDLVGRLAAHPNIVGLKDSASRGIESFLQFQGPSFQVLAGSANFLMPAMLGGSPGGTCRSPTRSRGSPSISSAAGAPATRLTVPPCRIGSAASTPPSPGRTGWRASRPR